MRYAGVPSFQERLLQMKGEIDVSKHALPVPDSESECRKKMEMWGYMVKKNCL